MRRAFPGEYKVLHFSCLDQFFYPALAQPVGRACEASRLTSVLYNRISVHVVVVVLKIGRAGP